VNAYAIIDLQFGSTGKGLLAGYLAKRRRPDAVVCAFGPNAGHTFMEADGTKWMHTMLPIGSIVPSVTRIFIGPGAIIDAARMEQEIRALPDGPHDKRIFIHPYATVLKAEHVLEEERRAGTRDTGSTRKGTGAALAAKIMREPVIAATELMKTPLERHVVTVDRYNEELDMANWIQIEGAQGFSLSHHHGFYPFVTSRDCTVHSLLSDCAIPRQGLMFETFGVCRTYPIRVNNRGGFSGGGYPDQRVMEWEEINVEPELTTVTRLPRRLFSFSEEQIRQAIRMSGVDGVFLNFCNYHRELGQTGMLVDRIEKYAPVIWTGWGPSENQIREEYHGSNVA
jgi:adenylosuccinate synthase